MTTSKLPVAVIGAGPVGLAAAAHLVAAGETPLVLEAGARAGAGMLEWAHVRVFTSWRYIADRAAAGLLEQAGWVMPDPEAYPTGGEIVEQYLRPLAELPAIAPHIRLDSRVVAVTRRHYDKMKTDGREQAPFVLRVRTANGHEDELLARAVIDASGTWSRPNPLGASGLPALGEEVLAGSILYGIPDALGRDRARYAGKRVLVVGGGHSAQNALLELLALRRVEPDTHITWAIRRGDTGRVFGGGAADELPERGKLGTRVQRLVETGNVELVTGFKVARLTASDEGITVWSAGDAHSIGPVDEIVAATGFRPDLAMLSELRLGLDSAVESTPALAPLIDPNVHSCGSVRPHGAEQLRHPEPDFYIAGMKSYGRAPTFLMLTGYEQVRSIVAALQGDWEAARRVELVLPETGVCSSDNGSGNEAAAADGCCLVPLPADAPAQEIVEREPEPVLVGAPAEQGTCCG